jgi:glycosyltransferase involved in cell wall biosynthesis
MSRAFLKLNDLTLKSFPSAVTCVSRVMQRHFEKVLDREVTYIPNGVEPPRPKAPNLITSMGLNGNDYILFAARLVPEKGAHYLIEAFRRLDLRRLHEMAGDNSKILFPCYISGDTFLELITNARLFVLPSEIEGMPVALLEAMSYGKCCVVSDIPENLEALNGHGFVFRNKSVEDLMRVLKVAVEDSDAAKAFGEQARNYVLAEYSWDRIVGLYEDFYRKVTADSQP